MQKVHTHAGEAVADRKAVDALMAVHRRTVDALTGYVTMVEKAEPSFRPVAEEFRALHAHHADRLARILTALGHEADHDGTFMGAINVAVVSLRAMFDTIDTDVMDNIRDGEDQVLTAFDAAVTASVDAGITSDVLEMRGELTDLLQKTRGLDA